MDGSGTLDRKIQCLAVEALFEGDISLQLKKLILEYGEQAVEMAIVQNGLATVLMDKAFEAGKNIRELRLRNDDIKKFHSKI